MWANTSVDKGSVTDISVSAHSDADLTAAAKAQATAMQDAQSPADGVCPARSSRKMLLRRRKALHA